MHSQIRFGGVRESFQSIVTCPGQFNVAIESFRPLPHVFVRGQLLGGSAEMQEAAATGLLYELLEESVLPPKGCVVPTRGKGPK